MNNLDIPEAIRNSIPLSKKIGLTTEGIVALKNTIKILPESKGYIDFLISVEYEKEMAEKIPKIKIGKHGQIMEWMKDYDEAEPGHCHISHLWALHPAFQITPDNTPDLCDAAKITLQRRLSKGGGHTGWSRAWIMNMYARLWDGENAYKQLLLLFSNSTLPNLFDTHPPHPLE